jgi:hypothetical protein
LEGLLLLLDLGFRRAFLRRRWWRRRRRWWWREADANDLGGFLFRRAFREERDADGDGHKEARSDE